MLGKLIKHEFMNSWKILLPLNLGAILAGIIVGIFFYNMPHLEKLPEPLIILLTTGFVGYCFLMAAVVILTYVFIIVRYYKSLYCAEGYLTFTLPATTLEIISAKMLVGFIWLIIDTLCIILSILLAASGSVALAIRTSPWEFQQMIDSFTTELNELFGINSIGIMILYIASALASAALHLLTMFFAISLGQLWQQHKVLGSVIFYFVVNAVMGTFNTLINAGSGTFRLLFAPVDVTSQFFTHIMVVSLVYSLVLCVAFYFASIIITDRKLNLD